MPEGQVLEFDRVTKRFGDVTAVSEFSGRVEPGVVTGFLGPNGAGKTTTLRMLLGMIKPTSGSATIGGAHYSDLKHAARIIGAMPEDPGFRPRRSVERHLTMTAKANGIPLARVDEVIRFVGLGSETESRIATLSLGMRQRLSAATALLGDPGALVLDEPANGLDPEGIRWMRLLIRGLADEGRTVLVSSHVLSEVEQVADEILIIARGQRKFAGSLATLADPTAGPVIVDALDRAALQSTLAAAGFEVEVLRSGLTVRGSDAATIGTLAAGAGVALTTLQQRGPTLEDVFLDLVNDRPVQFREPETTADATVALPIAADAAPHASDAPEAADAAEPTTSSAGEESDTPDAAEMPADTAAETAPGEADDAPAEDEGAPAEAAGDQEDILDDDAEDASAEATDAFLRELGETPAVAEPAAPIANLESSTAALPVVTSIIEIPSLVEDSGADTVDESSVIDEIPAAFAPVSAAVAPGSDGGETPASDERPLPGLAGLAAAAVGVTAPATSENSAQDAEGGFDQDAEAAASEVDANAEHDGDSGIDETAEPFGGTADEEAAAEVDEGSAGGFGEHGEEDESAPSEASDGDATDGDATDEQASDGDTTDADASDEHASGEQVSDDVSDVAPQFAEHDEHHSSHDEQR